MSKRPRVTHLVAAADLDAAIVNAEGLHRRQKVLHSADARTAAFAPPKRRAELRPWLGVPHLRGHTHLLHTLHQEIPTLSGVRREQRGRDARARVEPNASPAHGRRQRLLRPPRLAEEG